jgi:transposase-like protein
LSEGSCLLDYRNCGCLPEVKHTVINMSLKASGIRDTARVLRISTDTVLSELRKKGWCSQSGDIPLEYVYKYLFVKQ